MTLPHHRFRLQGEQGQLAFDLEAVLSAPWTVLFGSSGSGKSTIVRALAGLQPHLVTSFERRDAPSDTWLFLHHLAPEKRRLSWAPQQASLLPHLSTEANIRFPETLRRPQAHTTRIPEIVHLLRLEPLLRKHPQQLSGGERQRVSLARALAVPDASLLLLDEPFAGLDRDLRDSLLPPLRNYLQARSLPVLSVTHDPDEALLLAAEVLRLREGHLLAQGPARDVLAPEISRLASLVSPSPTSP